MDQLAMGKRPTLLLVDGSNFIFRAFYAMPNLKSADGEPTGAIYGMINMMRRLREIYPHAYGICVFDAKGENFRHQIYPNYKANRPAIPDDLVLQIEAIYQVTPNLGWPTIVREGVEADDVIGSITQVVVQQGWEVVIATGDKDLAQLVNDKVKLINTMNNEILDIDGVVAKFGVRPDQIVDYLSLVGDAVDNIPGVDKVGPKTAVKWLSQYHTLEEIMAHADEFKGVVGTNLQKALHWLPMAKQLITIKCDLPLNELLPTEILSDLQNPTQATPWEQRLQKSNLLAFYQRYQFKQWFNELSSTDLASPNLSAKSSSQSENALTSAVERGIQSQRPVPDPGIQKMRRSYSIIQDIGVLEAVEARLKMSLMTAIDTETDSLDPMTARLVGISVAFDQEAFYIPINHVTMESQIPLEVCFNTLREWLEGDFPKVGHNIKYDMHVFANHGVSLGGVIHDTLLQSYVLEADQAHGLDALAKRHLNWDLISYESLCGKGAKQISFAQVDLTAACQYAAEDADTTLSLHEVLYPCLQEHPELLSLYHSVEMPVMKVLLQMERHGVLIDVNHLNQQSQWITLTMQQLHNEIIELAGRSFNLNSPKQVGEVFFAELKLPSNKKTKGGAYSTDEETLQKLAEDYPIAEKLLKYRGLAKLQSTYIEKLPKMVNPITGRVHTHYGQAIAITGRLASNDPNLQNIPIKTPEGRRIREAFIARPHHVIVAADYSQIELRIMAHLSNDPNLLKAFSQGEDVHRFTASEIIGVNPSDVTAEQRRMAKVINFGLIYGMGVFGLAKNLGMARQVAQQYIERYFDRYQGVARYMAESREIAKTQGYVTTVLGRRLYLPDINSRYVALQKAAERAAINAPMQGTAADMIKLAMIAVQNWLTTQKLETKMIMQVHDELVFEVPENEINQVINALPHLMGQVIRLNIPIEVEVGVGKNWEQAH